MPNKTIEDYARENREEDADHTLVVNVSTWCDRRSSEDEYEGDSWFASLSLHVNGTGGEQRLPISELRATLYLPMRHGDTAAQVADNHEQEAGVWAAAAADVYPEEAPWTELLFIHKVATRGPYRGRQFGLYLASRFLDIVLRTDRTIVGLKAGFYSGGGAGTMYNEEAKRNFPPVHIKLSADDQVDAVARHWAKLGFKELAGHGANMAMRDSDRMRCHQFDLDGLAVVPEVR